MRLLIDCMLLLRSALMRVSSSKTCGDWRGRKRS